MNSDYEKFEANFLSKEKEILVLIEEKTNGAAKFGNSWSPSNHPLAFIDLESGELHCKDCRLEWLVPEGTGNYLHYFEAQKAFRLKVRPHKSIENSYKKHTFMLVEVLEEDVKNALFDAILEEYNKIVIYEDDDFYLELNRQYEWFEGEEFGKNHDLIIETENLDQLKIILHKYKALTQNFEEWKQKLKDFACKELLELANDWQEEGTPIITEAKFKENINLIEIIIDEENIICHFNDNDMFYSHAIVVYGDLEGNLDSANIEG